MSRRIRNELGDMVMEQFQALVNLLIESKLNGKLGT